VSVDPVTLEVIRSRMDEVVHNMEWLLFHSGYSPILRESYDGSACVLDAEGHVVVAAGMPMHGYPYHYHAQAIIKKAMLGSYMMMIGGHSPVRVHRDQ